MVDLLTGLGIPPASTDPTKNIFGATRPFGMGVPQDTPPGILAPSPGLSAPSVAGPVPEAAAPAAQPAVPGGAFGTGFMTRLGLGIMARANPAAMIKAAAPPTLGPQSPIGGTIAPAVGNYVRGLVGAPQAPSVAVAPVAPAAPAPARSSTPFGTTNGQPTTMGIPAAVSAAAPAAPQRRGFSALTPASAAAIAAFLPRQRMPQEIAGDQYLASAQRQRDAIVNDATRSADEKRAADAAYQAAYEKVGQFNQAGNLALMQQFLGGGIPQ